MKKAGVLLGLILLLSVSFVLAEDQALVDKAYTCLAGKVNKCSSITSPEEQALSILALSYKSDFQSGCKSALLANANTANNQQCWPKAGCKLKETSEAVLALNYIGADAGKAKKWLLSQNKTPTDINWYLEIDAREASVCIIKYDSNSTANTVTMAGDKKLSISGSGSGSCLSLANSNYWLQISQSCLGKTFRVSCDKDFYTAVLYKKTSSDVWYVSSKTQTASASGTTENSVNSLCFKQGTECDYEGSLWAALALQKNNNLDLFLPYLIANAPDNSKYNPYSFLNKLSPADEFTAALGLLQNPAGFWDLTSGYGKYYDTALSVLGLSGNDKAKDWLQSTQASDGCWPTVRDTALILWAVWQQTPAPGEVSIDYCEDYGKYCASHTDCNGIAGAEVLENYACKNGISICCSKPVPGQTCLEKQGTKCAASEDCTNGDLVSSTDSSRCCVNGGTCEKQVTPGCEQNQNTCRTSCLSAEEQITTSGNECNGNDMCCGLKTTTKSYWWIWLLIILIILVALAIVFRNRLRLFLFTLKNRFGKGKGSPVQQTRPPFPPSAMPRGIMPRTMPRPMPRSMPQTQPAKPKSRTDTELEETLRKLKDMSK